METLPQDLRAFIRQVHLKGVLTTTTALRLGAGRSNDLESENLVVVKDSLQRPVIPGSSFKGVMRSYAERLLRTLEPLAEVSGESEAVCFACDPLIDPCLTNEAMRQIKNGEKDRKVIDRTLYARSCWACRLFGAPWLASHVAFKDATVDDAYWFDRYEHRDGVSIDRDTGTAAAKRLYSFEVVPADIPFDIEIVVEDATEAELGLLLLALEGLAREQLALGGARSRGLGQVRLNVDWDHVEEITPQNALVAFGSRVRGAPLPTTTWPWGQRDRYIKALFAALSLPASQQEAWQAARSSGGAA